MAPEPKPFTVAAADEREKKNVRFYNKRGNTEKRFLKEVNYGRKHLSIHPNSQILAATKEWGPLGEGWGYDVDFDFQPGVVFAVGHMWWLTDQGGKANFSITGGSVFKADRPDSDATKKALTDAVTKGLSNMGFNADVFFGLWDDKYTALHDAYNSKVKGKPFK